MPPKPDTPAMDPNSVVPARLQGKSLPNEKLFCLLAALEHSGAFSNTTWKLASAFSDGHFTPAALEFNMREWRQETRKIAKEKGIEVSTKVETMAMTSGLGKGHAGAGKKKRAGAVEDTEDAFEKGDASPTKKRKPSKKKSEAVVKAEDGDEV